MSSTPVNIDSGTVGWRERVTQVVEMMREMSRHTDPQEMVLAYAEKVKRMLPMDRLVSVSRRGLDHPLYRVTRSTTWGLDRNPWKSADTLPVFRAGLLGDLLYGDEPRLIEDLQIDDDDPAAQLLVGMRSMMAIPVYDQGVALNMVAIMRCEPHAFDRETFADQVWTSNLFGRATQMLVLSAELKKTYETVDSEMKLIGSLQRSLLPGSLPEIPTMNLAVHYEPAARSGGDYYDFFPMDDGSWGVMIADVSGHGSPAAVLMAVTHALAHSQPFEKATPAQMLGYLNDHLTRRYTTDTGRFITAFFGVYDPSVRRMTYACAGHHPPRVKRCSDGSLFSLDEVVNPPLGIITGQAYDEAAIDLATGDQIIFFTDGITEAFDPDHHMFGVERLDGVLHNCMIDASGLIDAVLTDLAAFTRGRPADDDRTMLVAKIL